MSTLFFDNVSDAVEQQVQADMQKIREYNTPGFSAFRKSTKKRSAGEKGLRIPYWSNLPGGHTAYVSTSSDFSSCACWYGRRSRGDNGSDRRPQRADVRVTSCVL